MQESLRGIQLLLQVLEVVENQVSFPLGAGLLEYCPDFLKFLDTKITDIHCLQGHSQIFQNIAPHSNLSILFEVSGN